MLAVFVVTLLSGLAIKFGPRRFAAGFLLNCWFVIAIGLPAAYKLDGDTSHTWGQVLAWLAGSALWIAFAWVMWLARGRGSRPAPVPEIPGDTSAQRADQADRLLHGDPSPRRLARDRDRVRAGPPQRLLDAVRNADLDEVKPRAVEHCGPNSD